MTEAGRGKAEKEMKIEWPSCEEKRTIAGEWVEGRNAANSNGMDIRECSDSSR
jgi:hypothetical protein